MYHSLDYFAAKEGSNFVRLIIQGVINGEIKAVFDGEQYVIKEKEYRLRKNLFNKFSS